MRLSTAPFVSWSSLQSFARSSSLLSTARSGTALATRAGSHCPHANPTEFLCSLSIKGGPDEDAVLCTSEKTYTIRSVVLSNSVLVVTPSADLATGPNNDMPRIEVQESLSEIVELAPTVPKLHRLRGLLRGMQLEEGHEDEDEEVGYDEFDRPVSIVWRSS